MTLVFLEELQWETTRASAVPSCEWTLMPLAATIGSFRSLPAWLSGFSVNTRQALCFTHATFLRQAKYFLKTKLGLSDEEFSYCQLHPIYGTGQVDANSPIIWVLISSRLFPPDAARANGATSFSPDRSLQLQIFMIGFDDDSKACVNDFSNPDQSPDVLLQRATAEAPLWCGMISYTNTWCARNPQICIYSKYLAHYGFSAAGAPVLKTLPLQQPAVKFMDRSKVDPTSQKYLSLCGP
jgi:hypothetical protein